MQTAELAAQIAPANPQAHASIAALKAQSFVPDALPAALRENELAAALSPNDWRYWFALSRMRESAGEAEGAEMAARYATELAPNYAQIRWSLGNILLRRGKREAAFAELKRAAELNPEFASGLINAAFQNYQSTGLNDVLDKIGNSAEIRKALVLYLLQDKKFVEAVQIWNQLPAKEKQETGEQLRASLLAAKKFRTVLPLLSESDTNSIEKSIENQFFNAGFESDINVAGANLNPFDWQIAAGSADPQIALDTTQKHMGNRSLISLFNSAVNQDFRSISQTVTVAANTSYRLQIFARATGTNINNAIRWEILDAEDNRVLATTTPAVASKDDAWQELTADFTTGAATEAIIVRLGRAPCTLSPCAVIGKIWFDDFALQKIGKIDKQS